MRRRTRQVGAALLMAMLTVTLVATFAAAAMWQQWRSVEVEQAERTRVQSAWILTGAQDWARLILREDLKSASVDYLAEPWAVPLQEARLSTFLAAEKGVAAAASGDDTLDAFLSGQIIDLQSLMNVNNLVAGGKISEPWRGSFARLFELLGLPPAQLDTLAENLLLAADTSAANPSTPLAPLKPQQVEQLVWLGLAPETVAALQPHVTLIESTVPTAVNLNTASAEVIYATLDGLTMADAQRMVAERDRSHFQTVGRAAKLVGRDGGPWSEWVSVNSSYFESHGRLRLGQMVVEERAVLQRAGNKVFPIQRVRGAIEAPGRGTALPAR